MFLVSLYLYDITFPVIGCYYGYYTTVILTAVTQTM